MDTIECEWVWCPRLAGPVRVHVLPVEGWWEDGGCLRVPYCAGCEEVLPELGVE